MRKETEAVMEPALPRHGSNAVSARYLRFDSKSVHKIGQTGIDATHVMRRMITGAHILFYSQDPEADRAFFRNFHSVDVRHRWLIFALPPAEAAIHPTDTDFSQTHAGQKLLGAVLYLMCDDLRAQIATLATKGVRCTEIQDARWGISTTIPLPSGRALGLYQPSHETAINLNSKS